MTSNDEVIEACQTCLLACAETFAATAPKGSSNEILLCCRECEDICCLVIKSLAADSPMAGKIAQLCAEICDWCREECEQREDEVCEMCAKACEDCANACRNLA